MFLQGVSEKGSRVAVRADRVSIVRDRGGRSWLCADGSWVCVDQPFAAVVEVLRDAAAGGNRPGGREEAPDAA